MTWLWLKGQRRSWLGSARPILAWLGWPKAGPNTPLGAKSGSIGPTADTIGASKGQTLKHELPRTAPAAVWLFSLG